MISTVGDKTPQNPQLYSWWFDYVSEEFRSKWWLLPLATQRALAENAYKLSQEDLGIGSK